MTLENKFLIVEENGERSENANGDGKLANQKITLIRSFSVRSISNLSDIDFVIGSKDVELLRHITALS
ncbi:4072_t:CDS:1, partial [Ambispora gerdemannii]